MVHRRLYLKGLEIYLIILTLTLTNFLLFGVLFFAMTIFKLSVIFKKVLLFDFF